MKPPELIFGYAANSDLFSTVTDFVHKILSPATYRCHLCAITHGNLSMKQEWKSFIKGFPVKTTFLHKGEFSALYKAAAGLPAIFIQSGAGINEWISRREIERCLSVNDLKRLLIRKCEDYVQHHHTHIQ